MNLALSLIVQGVVMLVAITVLFQIAGKLLIKDYQDDFEE